MRETNVIVPPDEMNNEWRELVYGVMMTDIPISQPALFEATQCAWEKMKATQPQSPMSYALLAMVKSGELSFDGDKFVKVKPSLQKVD